MPDDLVAYKRVAAMLRRRMGPGGDLPPGFKLPSITTLARTQKVSTTTIRRAFRLLEDEGYIRAVEKSGHWVINREIEDWKAKIEQRVAALEEMVRELRGESPRQE